MSAECYKCGAGLAYGEWPDMPDMFCEPCSLRDCIVSLKAEIEQMRAVLVHIAEAWPSEDQYAAADWRVTKHIVRAARAALSQRG